MVKTVDCLPKHNPSELAGPLQPGCAINLSNTLGNIIVYRFMETTKVWVLRYDDNEQPVWKDAQEGESHPDADGLSGYVLSLRNINKPSWVKLVTIGQYKSSTKRKAAVTSST